MIPIKDFSDYFFENVACGSANQLQITSACNAKCIFCSNEQNPFDIERRKFRSLEEIKKVLWSMPIDFDRNIILNESLPGRLSEGEALLHPDFYAILAEIRKKFVNNVISITTNGSLLTHDTIMRMKQFLPIRVQISFPSANEKYWTETFNLNKYSFENAKNAFSDLIANDFGIFSSLTPMPSWTGWEDIEETISFVVGRGIKNILVYAPGYTDYTNKEVVSKLVYDKNELSDFLSRMSKKYGVVFDWSLDPNSELYVSHDIFTNIFRMWSFNGVRKGYVLTSNAAYERMVGLIGKLTRNMPVNIDVIKVNNKTYGGNIECCGLFMFKDIEEAIDGISDGPILAPGGFMDKYGFDLQGNSVIDFIEKHQVIFV